MIPPDLGVNPSSGADWARERTDLNSSISLLVNEIYCIQKRLGTPAELPDDLAKAAHLVHQVNNLRTTLKLNSGLRDEGMTPEGPPMVEMD